MTKFTIILFDSSLQTVSELSNSFKKHKSIHNDAIRENCSPNELIVDNARHYPAFKTIKTQNVQKMGRPDIIHHSLVSLIHHPVFSSGMTSAYVHTLGNLYFKIPNNWRIPANYIRFLGLMRQLFQNGFVPSQPQKKILSLHKGSLVNLIKEENLEGKKILFSTSGKEISLNKLILREMELESRVVFLIGGYQKGNPSQEVLELSNEVYSILPSNLTTWTTISLVMNSLMNHPSTS